MDRVRKVIADHMVMSKHTSPHVTNVVEVDVTKLVKWRDKNKDAFFRREGVKLTYMPAITEAVAKALAAYPQVNVSVEGYNILFKKHINVGIAVSLNDGNLIVPVVRDADRLNLNGLAVAIDSLALKARDNKLMPDDISGGTFYDYELRYIQVFVRYTYHQSASGSYPGSRIHREEACRNRDPGRGCDCHPS